MPYSQLYETMLNAYKRKGKIGRVKPMNLEHAKKVAHMVAMRLAAKQI